MPVEVRIPTLGESVTEGVIVRWLKTDGDSVQTDDALLELETDKANVELPSPNAGTLRRLKKEGETVQVGEVVAQIDTDGKAPAASTATAGAATSAAAAPSPTPLAPATPPKAAAPAPAPATVPPAATDPAEGLSPSVRR